MFFTLDLQLTSTLMTHEPSFGLTGTSTTPQHGKEGGYLPFSQLLGMGTNIALDPEFRGGEFLPQTGKPLPQLHVDRLTSPPILGIPAPAVSIDPKLSDALDVDLDLDLEIEVPYMPAEIAVTEPSHLSLLPTGKISGADTLSTPVKPAARLGTDAQAVVRPLQTLASEVRIALATQTQTQNIVAPTGDETIILPNAEGLVRDRIMRATRQAPVVAAVIADSSIDGSPDNLLAPPARTVGAVASVQRPGLRVSGPSLAQASAPANLTSMISPFASASGLTRGEPLLEAISTPVRDAAWGQKLGEQLITLTGNQIRTAEIKLTPADLGPLRVQISIDEGAVNITFQAQHAVTREAIEQALPRLREMLAESGLSLGQTDVNEEGVSEGNQEREFGSAASADEPVDGPAEADLLERRKTVTSNNLLDTFV